MSFNSIYELAGSAMSAQTVRLNTISSNLSNVDSVSGNPNEVYKALKPVFASIYDHVQYEQGVVPVKVADVVSIDNLIQEKFEPNNPLSNEEGYVYYSGINVISEMADMMSATRSFEADVQVLNNVKSMQQSLIRIWEI